MNEHIGPVVSFVFQEMLKQKMGLPLNTTVTDPIRQILWGQAFAKVHMSGVSGSCIPTNDEIRASVRTNFDALYAAYARMHGEQQSFYAGSQYWGAVPFTQATHTEATKQQIKAVEASTGGVGTVEERLLNMQRAFPAEFAELAAQVRAGTLVMGPIAEAFLLGNKTIVDNQQGTGSVVTAEQEFGEVLGESVSSPPEGPWTGYLHSIVNPENQRLAWEQMMNMSTGAASLDVPFVVRTDTGAGKLFSALIRGMRADASGAHIQQLAAMANYLTDIPVSKLKAAIYAVSENDDRIQDGPADLPVNSGVESRLKELFTHAQYGNIFTSAPKNVHDLVTAAPDKPTYQADEHIRVRFDMGLAGDTSYDHANVYLIVDGQRIPTQLTMDIKNALYVDIPVRLLRQYLGDRLTATVQIGIQLMTKTGEVLTMDNGKGIKTDSIKFELYTSDASLVRNAAELSEADIRELIDALKIDDFEHLPEGNQEILRYFYKNILPTLEYRDGELIGDVHGTGLAECKEWLQMNIILNSTGVLVPNNATKESGKWLSDEYAVAQLLAEENFENFLDRSDAKSGDVIQMYINDGDRHFPHTMVIGNITSDGIWVFDTNYAESSWSLVSNVPPNWNISGYTKGIINSQNGLPRELTADEIASGVVPTHWLQSDNSIRYHYISFAELNTVQAATLQRINI